MEEKKSFVCYECGQPMADEEFELANRKRFRGRRCRSCKNAAVVRKRHANPISLLQHRFYNSAHRLWPDADPSLWSSETVRAVYERCQGKCVLTGDTKVDDLCISYKKKDPNNGPPAVEDLVLVRTKEAQTLAQMSPEKRAKRFQHDENPPE